MSRMPGSIICLKRSRALLPALALLSATVAPAIAPAAEADAQASARATGYSVINLGPNDSSGVLNERGEVAFTSPGLDAAGNAVTRLRFFDGRRVRDHASFTDTSVQLTGLNELGTAVGRIGPAAGTAPPAPRAFTWNAARGLRVLPGPVPAGANAVNNLNRVVGAVGTPGDSVRAVLWNHSGARIDLGPVPPFRSEAFAINLFGVAAGGVIGSDGISHATLWHPAGGSLDLGGLAPFDSTTASHINLRGDVAGSLNRQTQRFGFYWSRERGMLLIRSDTGRSLSVVALNDLGDVAGNLTVSEAQRFFGPYIWSARDGYRALPLGGAPSGNLYGLNNWRTMVGDLQPSIQDLSLRRATLWQDTSGPVDLNTRLYRAPAGLVLASARAVNDRGDILVDSNAGLVLLRPGRQGTAAPVLGPITGIPSNPVATRGSTVDLAVGFVDSEVHETHTASASVSDGCPQTAPSLREVRGAGEVNLRHTVCRAGAFRVRVRVADGAGNASEVTAVLFVREPAATTQPGAATSP